MAIDFSWLFVFRYLVLTKITTAGSEWQVRKGGILFLMTHRFVTISLCGVRLYPKRCTKESVLLTFLFSLHEIAI